MNDLETGYYRGLEAALQKVREIREPFLRQLLESGRLPHTDGAALAVLNKLCEDINMLMEETDNEN
jgi:hypothetical protein